MKIILVFFTFLISFGSFSQVKNWIDFKEQFSDLYLTLNEVEKAIENFAKIDSIYIDDWEYKYSSKLGKKFKNTKYIFYREINSKTQLKYCLNVQSYRREVVNLELKKVGDTNLEYRNTNDGYNTLIDKHNLKFGIKSDRKHRYFNPCNLVYVSFGCYYGGDTSPEMDIIDSLVRDTNRNEIIKWCHSLSPEIRCHGAFGLLWLKEKGITLNQEERRLLNIIRNENTIILTCSGCDGPGEFHTIKEFMEIESEE